MKAIVFLVLSGLIAAGGVAWFGIYNVAANDKHFSVTSQLLEFVRERSISVRSDNIVVPDLEDKKLIKQGAEFYIQMCTECHLAPGMEQTEFNAGLYPQPPAFFNQIEKHKPSAQFWVIKNGLKMTGMPAWSPSHTDDQIWAMVAFINQLDSLSVDEYKKIAQEVKESGGDHHHGSGHGHSDTNDSDHHHETSDNSESSSEHHGGDEEHTHTHTHTHAH